MVPTARFERATPALGAVALPKIARAKTPDLRTVQLFTAIDRC